MVKKKILLPFRYPGGKYYALKLLRPFWTAVEHDEYREPMVGGGSVFFAKDKVKHNWINDLHDDLIITYKAMRDPDLREELINLISNEQATKERHKEIKEFQPNNELEIAYKYYYLNRTSFSGKMKSPAWGYRPVRSLPPERWKERILPCGEKLMGVDITNLDYDEVIQSPAKENRVLMFLDPPYYKAKQESHYVCPFKKEDHIRLMKSLKNTEHKFFLTYDDVEEVRQLYDWAYIYPINFFYRLDNSQDNKGNRNLGFELVITNYEMKSENSQLGLLDFNVEISNGITKNNETGKKVDTNKKVKSPFRFPGSKAQAIKFIRPFWESALHDEFREPFIGGGAVFFAKPKVEFNWINDIDNDLITTYKTMADSQLRKKLIEKVSKEVATRERHIEMKSWQPKDKLDIAYRYYYLNRTSYSGIMKKPAWGYHPTKSVPPERWGSRIDIAGKKLQGVKITSLDYHDIIEAPPQKRNVFMFVDPPYFEADQKRAYEYYFKENDHIELCEVLKKTKHKFCLTYDNCQPIQDMYSWANLYPVSWRYHTANSKKAERKMGNELIISNFKGFL